MASPTLSLRDCMAIDSPVTILTPCINLGEFEEDASTLEETFCTNKMSEDQFDAEAATETEKALKVSRLLMYNLICMAVTHSKV